MSAVVLFDGVCNFCDSSVNFVIEHDREGYFKFATLQSEAGQAIAAKHGFSSETFGGDDKSDLIPLDSVILVENGLVYTHSTAALRIVKRLGGFWSWFYPMIVIPESIRDFFYRLFAKYRYRMFGKKDECMLPSPEVRARFL